MDVCRDIPTDGRAKQGASAGRYPTRLAGSSAYRSPDAEIPVSTSLV